MSRPTRQLLVEVERLRYVRVLLADVEPSSISVRESLLANALDAWDRVTRTTHLTRRAPTRRTRTAGSWVPQRPSCSCSPVASCLQTVSSGTDDDSATQSASDVTTRTRGRSARRIDRRRRSRDRRRRGGAVSTGSPPIAASDGAELDTGINDAAPPTETELEQLDTPEELGIFASDAVGAPQDPEVPAATSESIDDRLTDSQATILAAQWPLCLGADYVVGPARYRTTERGRRRRREP